MKNQNKAYISHTSKERDQAWDIVKAICIILMVAGHCQATIGNVAGRWIYLFHMGTFFFASGFFLHQTNQQPLRHTVKFFTRKVRSIYLPYVVSNLIFLLLHNYIYSWHITPLHYSMEDMMLCAYKIVTIDGYIESPLLVPSWFLRTLFVTIILAHLIICYLPKIWQQAIVVVGLYSAAYIADRNIFNMQRELIVLSTVWLGYLAQRSGRWNSGIANCPLFLLTSLILIGLALLKIDINVNIREYSYYGMFPLCTLLGCYLCYCTATVIIRHSQTLTRALCYIGQHTMSILLLSFSMMYLTSWILILIYGRPLDDLQFAHTPIEQQYVLWDIVYLLMGVGGPLGLNYLWLKINNKLSV